MKKYSLLFLCLSLICFVKGQSNDSAQYNPDLQNLPLRTLINQAKAYIDNAEYDLAYQYIQEAKLKAVIEEYADAQFEVYELHFSYLLETANYRTAYDLAQKSLDIDFKDKQLAGIHLDSYRVKQRMGSTDRGHEHLVAARAHIGADTLSSIGIEYYTYLGDFNLLSFEYDIAIDSYTKAISICRLRGEEPSSLIMHNLSILYQSLSAYELALDIDIKNRKKAQEENNIRAEIFALYSISTSYLYLQKYEESKSASLEALELSEQYKMKQAIGYAYAMMSRSLFHLGDLDEAEQYCLKGIAISKAQEEKKELADCQLIMGMIQLEKNNIAQALANAEAAKENRNYFDVEIIDLLAAIYERIGDDEKHLNYLSQSIGYYKNQSSNSKFYDIMTALVQEKLESETQQMQQQYQAEVNRKIYLTILFSLIICLMFLGYFLYKQRQSNRKLIRLNQKLEKKNEDLNQFTYITSHDLKEPIRNVKSFVGLIDRKLKKNNEIYDETKEYIDFISNSANTLNKIIESLRVYTSISNGKIIYHPVPLEQLFKTLKDNLSFILKKRNGQLIFNNESKIDTIWFNNEMILLVLQNLIQNGFKHNDKEKPIVEVNIVEESDQFLIQVKDNGPGIDKPYFEKIFEPFKTLQNKSITNSSGLGLSICKNILQRYNETIWLESEPGAGTTFIFSIAKRKDTTTIDPSVPIAQAILN